MPHTGNENDPRQQGDRPPTRGDLGHAGAGDLDPEADPGPDTTGQDVWFLAPPAREPDLPPAGPHRLARRLPLRGWAALAALAAVTLGVIITTGPAHHTAPHTARGPATTASPATTTSGGACAGLTGTVATSRGGDPATLTGVIAQFEQDYYTTRSAPQALQLLAPEAAITPQGLAEGIASIPVGTTYCVAITPIAATTANVHLVEVHPDKVRVDYLQVINTRPVGGGMLISHVQEQG